MAQALFPKLAVIGCGLIGSSLIRGARAAGAVGEVAVADASPRSGDCWARMSRP